MIRSMVKRLAGLLGYRVEKIRLRSWVCADLPYQDTRHPARYAPWNDDEDFKSVHRAIKDLTNVNFYRLWELWTLVRQSAKVEGALIEIGVRRGGSGALIARQARLSNISDTVYLCDSFKGNVKAGDKDWYYRGGEHTGSSRRAVEELMKELNITNARILEGVFPEESAHELEAKGVRFRFCHIDVGTYRSTRDIVEWIWGRMVRGGILVLDDYGVLTSSGVTKYINELLDKKDRHFIYNMNGHAILIKL